MGDRPHTERPRVTGQTPITLSARQSPRFPQCKRRPNHPHIAMSLVLYRWLFKACAIAGLIRFKKKWASFVLIIVVLAGSVASRMVVRRVFGLQRGIRQNYRNAPCRRRQADVGEDEKNKLPCCAGKPAGQSVPDHRLAAVRRGVASAVAAKRIDNLTPAYWPAI